MTEGRAQRIPTPPTMHNAGFYTASICEIVRWMGERAEQAGVNLFTGFPVDALLVEGDAVRGVRTTPSGLDRDRQPTADYGEPTDVTAKVTVIAEGTRGLLSQGWCEWQQVRSPNPQIFALGVKEVWQTPKPLNTVIHTLGWPLPDDAFGGSFMYPLGPEQIALGLVVGLDYHDASLDVHELLQRMKLHPLFRPYLEGGELLEWGAKTIPEGGYHALLERRSGDGILLVGDAVGLVDVPSLKGIHYAMQSGIYAARAAFAGLKQGDLSAARLSAYDRLVDESYIVADMYRTRNMRLAFKDGLYVGGFKAGLMTISGGRLFGGRMEMPEDAATPRRVTEAEPFTPDGKLTFGKLDAVFKSGNATRDTIPSHLLVGPDVSARGRRVLLPRVPRRRLRARGRRAPGQCAELHRLQGDRRARTALDAARGGQRAQVPRDVAVVLPHLAVPRRGGCRETRHCALPADCAAASSFPTLYLSLSIQRPSSIPSLRGALWDRTR